jgi:membrane fusion protein (multidrug efflux system)
MHQDATTRADDDRAHRPHDDPSDDHGDPQRGASRDHDDAARDEAQGDRRGDADGKAPRKPRSKLPLIILGIVVLLAAIGALVWWLLHRNEEHTDDAFTDGNTVAIASQVAGYIVELDVDDNVRVHKGDLLLRIDSREYAAAQDQSRAALELAQAQLRESRIAYDMARVQFPAQLEQALAQEGSARAALDKARADSTRQHGVDPRATSQQTIDAADVQQENAQAGVDTAHAQVKVARLVPEQVRRAEATVRERAAQLSQAEAALARAALQVGYCEIRAPADGWVTKRSIAAGSYVQPGMALFTVVTPEVWVTANFKESQLARMRVGNSVRIKVDAYPDLDLRGHVDSIQLGSGSRFSAFPAENATGNFVKIVQRVPVKIVIDSGLDPSTPLPLGLSAEPTVDLP